MGFRFLHCSDIHLLDLKGVGPHRFLNKRMTGGVNLLLRRRKGHDGVLFDRIVEHAHSEGVDRLVVTGDVTNLALESEFDLVRRKLDSAGLPVTVIPGNHDTYTRGSVRVKRFESFFMHHMDGERIDDEPYPFAWRDPEGLVALVGVSTAIPTPPMSAVGAVGPAQLGRLSALLERVRPEVQTTIVLIHHPVKDGVAKDKHELLDIDQFGAVIAKHGADLILHGHEHEMMEYAIPGPAGDVPVHGIASGTARSERPGRAAAFAIYAVDHPDRAPRIQRRVFRLRGEQFVEEKSPASAA
jgi:3',5'-cyclic AMP phosphodiesterase CpdA